MGGDMLGGQPTNDQEINRTIEDFQHELEEAHNSMEHDMERSVRMEPSGRVDRSNRQRDRDRDVDRTQHPDHASQSNLNNKSQSETVANNMSTSMMFINDVVDQDQSQNNNNNNSAFAMRPK